MGVSSHLKDTLGVIGVQERYSGVTSGILQAVVRENTKVVPTSEMLHIGKKALYRAKEQKLAWEMGGEYSSLIIKVVLKKSRKPANLKDNILQWLMDNTRPSSNSKNVIKWKGDDGLKKEHIVQ